MEGKTFLTIQKRGVLNLPAELRRRHHLDEAGAQVEVSERPDGVIELRPQTPVPSDQRWFWTERWQNMEREADADVAAGRVERFDTAEDFIADLDEGE
jgi:bifunctional DNA-binding transcriptional regulator/antitoxin component of YhaV-PrlF toxin-antitoxin module